MWTNLGRMRGGTVWNGNAFAISSAYLVEEKASL